MGKKIDLPKVWKDCPDTQDVGNFEIQCPKCLRTTTLEKRLFLPKSGAPREGLEDTGVLMSYLSKSRATFANFIAAVITVIVVFTVVNPREKNLQGAVLLVGLPVLAVGAFVLRRLLSTRMKLWAYRCEHCHQELAVISNGTSAAFGSREAETAGVKGGTREKVEEKALEFLISDLKSESSEVREKTVEALAEMKDRRRIEPLIEALRDNDRRVREKAALALVASGDKRAVGALFRQSQTDEKKSARDFIRFTIANHIKGISPARAILKGMESKDEMIHDLACEAFLNQRDGRALENLKRALKDAHE